MRTPETDREWEHPTMNILEWARKLEVERDQARRRTESLRDKYQLIMKHNIERGVPFPWERK